MHFPYQVTAFRTGTLSALSAPRPSVLTQSLLLLTFGWMNGLQGPCESLQEHPNPTLHHHPPVTAASFSSPVNSFLPHSTPCCPLPKGQCVLPSGRMLLPTPCMLTHVVWFSQWNLSRDHSCHISVEAWRAPRWLGLSSSPSALGQGYLRVVVASLAWGLE